MDSMLLLALEDWKLLVLSARLAGHVTCYDVEYLLPCETTRAKRCKESD